MLPPRPRAGDDDSFIVDLAAIAGSARPAPSTREDEVDALVDLTSWNPGAPSAFPPAWTMPPRAHGRGLRVAAVAGVAMTLAAVGSVALLTASRLQLAPPALPTARIEASQATEAPVARAVVPLEAPPLAIGTLLAPVEEVAPAAVPRAHAVEAAAVVATEPDREAPVDGAPLALVEAAPDTAPVAAEELPSAAPNDVAPAETLPAVPTREGVVASIDAVRPAVRACAATRHGSAPVLVTVGSNGRVRSAVVSGTFAGTPEGSCIARAVRAAEFPAFTQATFELSYPFAL